jgi:hypothetical protein
LWDFRENTSQEKETLLNLVSTLQLIEPDIQIVKLTNDFTDKTSSNLTELI